MEQNKYYREAVKKVTDHFNYDERQLGMQKQQKHWRDINGDRKIL